MNRAILQLVTVLSISPQIAAANGNTQLQAALSFRPDAQWKMDQARTADIDCDGKPDIALLGTTQHEVIVLVFRSGLKRKPDAISFQASRIAPETANLATEPLDVTASDFKEMLGQTPEGYRRSKTCMGLALTDGQKDALHVYWHRRRHELGAWSL